MTDRGMRRSEFTRLMSTRLSWGIAKVDGFNGYAGILDIDETAEDWYVESVCGMTCIAASSYKWLQLSPFDDYWWLTVMYDRNGMLVQYYFDIIKEKYLSEENEPRFIDMYLDIVMDAGGEWRLLDKEELDAALLQGIIDKRAYNTTLECAAGLIGAIDGKEQNWRRLCERIKAVLTKSKG